MEVIIFYLNDMQTNYVMEYLNPAPLTTQKHTQSRVTDWAKQRCGNIG